MKLLHHRSLRSRILRIKPKRFVVTMGKKRLFLASFATLSLLATAIYATLATTHATAYGANAFVMVVKTDNPGTSNSTSFTIPTTGAGYSYNVDCNDDGINEVTARTTSYTCVYGSAGTYTVAITGTFPRVYFNNGGDRQKLLEVQQWGTTAWTSMANAFYGCNNMHVTATDAPNLAGVTNLSRMFERASVLDEPLDHWDVSTVVDMSRMFYFAADFNQPIGSWNTSAVTNMSQMFNAADSFNQPIGSWDTSSVINMSGLFSSAISFNQPIGGWNTGSVTNLSSLFSNATSFNQSIDTWDTSVVVNMNSTFRGAASFNQPLADWDTSAATNMGLMFYGAAEFNQPINSWNTSSVTTMSQMFQEAAEFNQPINSWNTSSVTTMSQMFHSAKSFNQPLGSWDTSAVTSLSGAFRDADGFNQPISDWDTSAVLNMNNIFYGADAFNQGLGAWNIGSVIFMYGLFDYSGLSASNYDSSLGGWSTQDVQSNVQLDAKGIPYCNEPARTALTSIPNNWTINDGGFCPPVISTPTHLSVTSDSTPTIAGMAVGTRTVHIEINGVTHASVASAAGTYSFEVPEPLANGWYSMNVRSTDGNGAPGASSLQSFYVHASGEGDVDLSGSQDKPIVSWDAPLNKSAMVKWIKTASDESSFPERANFGAVSFNDRLWVLGGQGTGSGVRYNDVWSSSDGITWTQEISNAPWSARNGHTVTIFNGKIWVTGGYDATSTTLNDVWSSTDGIHWTQETASAQWSARGYHGVIVYNHKIWVTGGYDATSTTLNDVWSSTDGVDWTQETASAQWSARGALQTAVFENKLWLIAGYDSLGYKLADVWSSTDGVDWTQETASAQWSARGDHQVQVFDNKLWLIGGDESDQESTNDVWFSQDGVHWMRANDATDWPLRRGHSSAVHNGTLWVLGGKVGAASTRINDVWRADIPEVTYTVCWDAVQGGCVNTADTTDLTFQIPQVLGAGSWYFSVIASTDSGGQVLANYASTPYVVGASSGGNLADTGLDMRKVIIGAVSLFVLGALGIGARYLTKAMSKNRP